MCVLLLKKTRKSDTLNNRNKCKRIINAELQLRHKNKNKGLFPGFVSAFMQKKKTEFKKKINIKSTCIEIYILLNKFYVRSNSSSLLKRCVSCYLSIDYSPALLFYLSFACLIFTPFLFLLNNNQKPNKSRNTNSRRAGEKRMQSISAFQT